MATDTTVESRKGNGIDTPVDEETQVRVHDRRVPTWPLRIASVIFGILWLTATFWKLPWNDFVKPGEKVNGIEVNTSISEKQPGPYVDTGSGLYHWMTQEAIHGNKVVPFYGDIIKNVVLPNWRLFGWLTFFLEGTIGIMLITGLLTRLAGFLGLMQALNLYVGLSQAPGEWPWSYGQMIILSFIFMFTGAGRVWGIDQFLRPTLRERAAAGSGFARLLYKLT